MSAAVYVGLLPPGTPQIQEGVEQPSLEPLSQEEALQSAVATVQATFDRCSFAFDRSSCAFDRSPFTSYKSPLYLKHQS